MRLWTIHPEHLDSKGLVALWRESLLAKKVLEGQTKGYVNHPQLKRFRSSPDPLAAINFYLEVICDHAATRGYNFNSSKFLAGKKPQLIPATEGQVEYETKHLANKLLVREPGRYHELIKMSRVSVHPLFYKIPGLVEDWEIITPI